MRSFGCRLASSLRCYIWCNTPSPAIDPHPSVTGPPNADLLPADRWNSVVFTSIPFTVFTGAIATSDVLSAPDRWLPYNTTAAVRRGKFTDKEKIYDLKERARAFAVLNRSSCLKRYTDPLQATSDLVVVAKNISAAQNNGSSIIQGWVNGLSTQEWDAANGWVCYAHQPAKGSRFCSPTWAASFTRSWKLDTWEAPKHRRVAVDYCLVGDEGNNAARCGLHFSVSVMALVCFGTFMGFATIVWMAITERGFTMVTMGDAIAEFLEHPEQESSPHDDEFASNYGRMRVPLVRQRRILSARMLGREKRRISGRVALWSPKPSVSWFRAVSIRRWLLSYSM